MSTRYEMLGRQKVWIYFLLLSSVRPVMLYWEISVSLGYLQFLGGGVKVPGCSRAGTKPGRSSGHLSKPGCRGFGTSMPVPGCRTIAPAQQRTEISCRTAGCSHTKLGNSTEWKPEQRRGWEETSVLFLNLMNFWVVLLCCFPGEEGRVGKIGISNYASSLILR